MLPKAAGTDRFISSATGVCWVTYRSADASPVTVFENGDETNPYIALFFPCFFPSLLVFLSGGKTEKSEFDPHRSKIFSSLPRLLL